MENTILSALVNAGGLGIFSYTVWVQLKAQVEVLRDLSESVIKIAERQSSILDRQKSLEDSQNAILEKLAAA